MRRWRPYSQRYLVVGLIGLVWLVGLALWFGLGLALIKYRCKRPDNDDGQPYNDNRYVADRPNNASLFLYLQGRLADDRVYQKVPYSENGWLVQQQELF